MQPLRENVAIAIDGGGVRGVVVARALAMLEAYLGQPIHQIARLVAGTSTGSVLSAGIAAGLPAQQMYDLYFELGEAVFQKSWRTWLWPLSRYKYPSGPLEGVLRQFIGDRTMAEFWAEDPATDIVITTFDLQDNRTRFIKPWKWEYKDWPVIKAVLSSCSVPTYFPVVEGRYVDGGVGAYSNPCYLAAYELIFCLGWNPDETTLLSLGTGRSLHKYNAEQASRLWAWQWLEPLMGAFLQSADDQQVHLVNTFFQRLDFRRFQVTLNQPIAMDDASKIPRLAVYGDEMGRMILGDKMDRSLDSLPDLPG